MAKILLLSDNAVFAADLKLQLDQHQDWEVREDYVPENVFDAAVVDDDAGKLQNLRQNLLKTPLFLLWSGETELPEDEEIRIVRKPFRLEGLIDALHTAINAVSSESGDLMLCGCRLDIAAREIRYTDGREAVKLTEREVSILKYLYKAGSKIVNKTELLAEVWGYNPEATTHTVETHIYRLRQKIEQDDGQGRVIITEDNGYRLRTNC
mgnify:CR=1 FL=1